MPPEKPELKVATIHPFPALKQVRDVTVDDTLDALQSLHNAGEVRDVLAITVSPSGEIMTMYSGKDGFALAGMLERLKLQVLGLAG